MLLGRELCMRSLPRGREDTAGAPLVATAAAACAAAADGLMAVPETPAAALRHPDVPLSKPPLSRGHLRSSPLAGPAAAVVAALVVVAVAVAAAAPAPDLPGESLGALWRTPLCWLLDWIHLQRRLQAAAVPAPPPPPAAAAAVAVHRRRRDRVPLHTQLLAQVCRQAPDLLRFCCCCCCCCCRCCCRSSSAAAARLPCTQRCCGRRYFCLLQVGL